MAEQKKNEFKIVFGNESSQLIVCENWCENYYEELLKLELTVEPKIKIMGKECVCHRSVGFFSDNAHGYKFAGQEAKASHMTQLLGDLTLDLNKRLGTSFNGILVNLYRNGKDYIGKHSDNQTGLSNNMVAGIAFGTERTFRIRDKTTNKILYDYAWKPMTLVLMCGNFQSEFTHEIPVQSKIEGSRISLTFRVHK